MLDTHARKYFDPGFNALAKIFLSWNLKPDCVTIFAIALGIGAAFLVWGGYALLGITLLWISGVLDAVDGSMARQLGVSSKYGTLLDIVGDRFVEVAIFWALALRNPESQLAMMGLLTAVLLSMTVFLTSGILVANTGVKEFYYQAGLMERTEGFIASTIMIAFQQHIVLFTWAYAALVFVTIAQRLFETGKLLKQSDVKGEEE